MIRFRLVRFGLVLCVLIELVRLCKAWLGWVRLGRVRLEMARFGFNLVWFGFFRLGSLLFGLFPCLKKKLRGKYRRGKTVGEKI